MGYESPGIVSAIINPQLFAEESMVELLNMDCMDYLADQPDKSFDLAIVDPPYGISVKANMGRRAGQENRNPPAEWDSAPPDKPYFKELMRVSKNQVIWGANHFIENMPINSRCWLVWDKRFSDELTFSQVEMAWTSFDGMSKKFDRAPSAGNAGGRFQRIHPTQKPIVLYQWILKNYAEPGQRILDTHLGSGSSAIAAHYFGCDFVGIELDETYFKAAQERFDNETEAGGDVLMGEVDSMADDYTKASEAYIAALEQERDDLLDKVWQWIPVEERLPDYDVPVLAVSTHWPDQITAAMRFDEGDGWLWAQVSWHGALSDKGSYEADDDYQYSHWMPLPSAPTEDKP